VHEQLLHYLRKQQWHFRLRLMGNTLIHLSAQPVSAVRDLCPPAGEKRFFHEVTLLGAAVGPVHLALACLTSPMIPGSWEVLSLEAVCKGQRSRFALLGFCWPLRAIPRVP
jgi:hypothetical protein